MRRCWSACWWPAPSPGASPPVPWCWAGCPAASIRTRRGCSTRSPASPSPRAAALAAIRATEARRIAARLGWLALVGLLALAALLPGGRAALAALVLALAAAPAIALWRRGRRRLALAWPAAAIGGAAAMLAVVLADPSLATGLRTVERLAEGEVAESSGRLPLWRSALAAGGAAMPWGLGTGGFAIAAGHGERRGLHPHNHGLEALAEGGLPGLLLWLAAFAGAAAAALPLGTRAEGWRSARVAALVLPVALSVMVSTDLGNRMVWFALGLALGLGSTRRRRMYAGGGKRAFDIVAAALLLAALAPVLAAVAFAVRLGLGAPVIFRQRRAGRGGAPFTLLKFRTMRGGPGGDAQRLTPLGRALRALALDELPQLLNVLRGEMSLVGPRPLPPDYLLRYTPRERMRLRVRPGLAGLAQAAGRNAVPWAARLELDARYAETPPLLAQDAWLLARSALLALAARGATAPGHATMPRLAPDRNITSG